MFDIPEECKTCKHRYADDGCNMWKEYCITAIDLCRDYPKEKESDKTIY